MPQNSVWETPHVLEWRSNWPVIKSHKTKARSKSILISIGRRKGLAILQYKNMHSCGVTRNIALGSSKNFYILGWKITVSFNVHYYITWFFLIWWLPAPIAEDQISNSRIPVVWGKLKSITFWHPIKTIISLTFECRIFLFLSILIGKSNIHFIVLYKEGENGENRTPAVTESNWLDIEHVGYCPTVKHLWSWVIF